MKRTYASPCITSKPINNKGYENSFRTRIVPRVVRRGRLWFFVVDKCPYCGKIHRHGGEDFKLNPPDNFYGLRVSHCYPHTDYLAGYHLVKEGLGGSYCFEGR